MWSVFAIGWFNFLWKLSRFQSYIYDHSVTVYCVAISGGQHKILLYYEDCVLTDYLDVLPSVPNTW